VRPTGAQSSWQAAMSPARQVRLAAQVACVMLAVVGVGCRLRRMHGRPRVGAGFGRIAFIMPCQKSVRAGTAWLGRDESMGRVGGFADTTRRRTGTCVLKWEA
jgi:hypothetical protein